jgi:mRNA-degrading endonuclease RelE of RelBE toxin-antitoxin system
MEETVIYQNKDPLENLSSPKKDWRALAFEDQAKEEMLQLSEPEAARIWGVFNLLLEDPWGQGIKKLGGTKGNEWLAARAGRHRILFKLTEDKVIIRRVHLNEER